MRKTIATLIIVALMSSLGCANRSGNIPATFVSSHHYKHKSCEELRRELMTVERQLERVADKQNRAATSDKVAMATGMIVFAPALLWFCVPNDHEHEVARLKGEIEAIESVMYDKCKGK